MVEKRRGFVRLALVAACIVLHLCWQSQTKTLKEADENDKSEQTKTKSGAAVEGSPRQHPYLTLLKTKTKDWQAFDSSSTVPLFNDRGYNCTWGKYQSQYSQKTADMCLHSEKELISRYIRNKGHWDDCFSVSRQYHQSYYNNHTQFVPVHLEIGANIGSCTMELLLANPDVHIVAFEPFPKNLFCLSSTLLRNPSLQKRVTIFPVALGSERTEIDMVVEDGPKNMGSARLYSEPGQRPETKTNDAPERIHVERLDEILAVPQDRVIPFAKMDTQGSECSVLEGMKPSLLPHIARLITEIDVHLLSQFKNCSSSILLGTLRNQGMKLYRYHGVGGALNPRVDETKNSNVVAIQPKFLHKG